MSLCRWSTDDFSCDLYIYYDYTGGITTHVAGNRPVGEIPKTPDFMTSDPEVWLKAHKKQMEFLEHCEQEPIDLPYAGETFNDPDEESLVERLKELKEIGYRFPLELLELEADVEEEP